jgi:hypothetical protein
MLLAIAADWGVGALTIVNVRLLRRKRSDSHLTMGPQPV